MSKLEEVANNLTNPPKEEHSGSLFADAYDTVKQHPGESLAVAALAAGAVVVTKGRIFGSLAEGASKEAGVAGDELFNTFSQAGYKHVPYRVAAEDIYAKGGPTLLRDQQPLGFVKTFTDVPPPKLDSVLAGNQAVSHIEPWLRSATIRGGSEYLQAKAEQVIPAGTNSLVKDAWLSSQAQSIPPEVIKTIGAVTQGLGEKACVDVAAIDRVAAMVGPTGRPTDYVEAYKTLQAGTDVLARLKSVPPLTNPADAALAAARMVH